MRAVNLSLGALALSIVSALQPRWDYPNCDPDNCYREMVDDRFAAEANSFCPEFLSGTTTAPSAIPTDFGNCGGDITAVSSACSCITYTLTATSTSSGPTTSPTSETTTSESSTVSTSTSTSTSTSASTTPSSSPVTTPSSTAPSSTTPLSTTPSSTTPTSSETSASTSEGTTSVLLTTSTIYTTTVYTKTSCAPTVTNCPAKGHLTTETIILSTTVCPVSSVTTPPVVSGILTTTLFSTSTYTITSCPLEVTNCPVGKVTTTVYPVTTAIVPPPFKGSTYAGISTFTYPAATGTGKGGATKTSSGLVQVTGAAGRVGAGLELAAAAAGLAVAFL